MDEIIINEIAKIDKSLLTLIDDEAVEIDDETIKKIQANILIKYGKNKLYEFCFNCELIPISDAELIRFYCH